MSDSNNGFFKEGNSIRVVNLFEWLDWAGGINDEVFIALPMIQRGSVWKPHQIIDLWDTLLRGMPVGSLMAQHLHKDEKVRRIGGHELIPIPDGGGLSLLDGQQRTLSMLIPWAKKVSIDKKVWVDFNDDPQEEHLYRLRVTTENHPFGFQKSSPSSRLSLGDRNKARKAYDDEYPNDNNIFKNAKPWGSKFPVDLAELISLWKKHKQNKDAFIKSVLNLDKVQRDNSKIKSRISSFYESIERLFNLQIPIIKVGSEMFDDGDIPEVTLPKEEKDIAPPLAVLFKRIGTGGSALTDADYVYSLIKYRLPEAYTLVEKLHEKHNAASLLSATNLVMSAVRIAVAEFNDLPSSDKKKIPDWESPSKRDFHSLLSRGENFLEGQLKPLITVDANEHGPLIDAFKALSDLLEYRKNNDIGLPKYAFPLLHRPLVQVLLRWIRQAQLHHRDDIENIFNDNRARVIRFVLYWRVFVKDPKDASIVAYKVLAENKASNTFPDKIIYEKLVEKEDRAIRITTPDAIKHIAFSMEDAKLRGSRRFEVTKPEEKQKIELYSRWWGNGGHIHPILLWLQRDFVSSFCGDPMAGRDEETPYDYDHICPSSYWYNNGKSDKNKDRIIDYLAEGDGGGHWRVGNSIGNVRVWGSSDNRSDGDDSPAEKILNRIDSRDILVHSAVDIESEQIAYWQKCSGEKAKGRIWDLPRVQAFQQAVEHRAFALYERYYTELGFDAWVETEVRTTSDSIAS